MKKALLIIACLGIFAATQPVFAECVKVEVVLQHAKMAITVKIHGEPQKIIESDGTSRCPTPTEIINKLLEMFPDFILKEYKEFDTWKGDKKTF